METFNTYVQDVVGHIEEMTSKHPGVPSMILGHSMVSCLFCIRTCTQADLITAMHKVLMHRVCLQVHVQYMYIHVHGSILHVC